jgi:hypothetical protein
LDEVNKKHYNSHAKNLKTRSITSNFWGSTG